MLLTSEEETSHYQSQPQYQCPSRSHSISHPGSLSVLSTSCHALDLEGELFLHPTNLQMGLSSAQVLSRQQTYGPNDVTTTMKRNNARRRVMLSSRFNRVAILFGTLTTVLDVFRSTILAKYLEQFKNPLILLLLASAAISLLVGQIENCISITLAVLLVVTVAFIQEYRTEKSLEELNRLAPPLCRVLRDGRVHEILACELVPGDIVELNTGDRIPADLRLFTNVDLEIDESMLTGETKACRKSITDEAFMATLVRQGRGQGVVTSIGVNTRLGRMYTLMRETDEKRSPLQCHLDRLGEQLSMYSLIVIAILAFIGFLQRQPLLQIFTVAVSLAVAAIPEGLPVVATITLALGVLRLSKKNVIVRKLPAVEALGSVDVLCVDKTGTLTMNQLSIQEIIPINNNTGTVDESSAARERLLTASVLCNNAQRGIDGREWHGNAIDVAIRRFADSLGISNPSEEFPHLQRVEEVSFTSERKYMAVKYYDETTDDHYYCVKGAAEVIIPMTTFSNSETFHEKLEWLYGKGLRVIAVAAGSSPKNLEILGLIGMCDPPRPDIITIIAHLKQCRVHSIMVTGDSCQTAKSVAKQVGWIHYDSAICSGDQLAELIQQEKSHLLDQISIVYRATPEHKLVLVDALQKRNHIVAMTGDGVNDAPALKMADIGVAMGRSGTDVARAAAQIILTDDRLTSLIDGIEEGKAIFSNIRHFIRFQLSTSLAALSLIALSMLFGGGSTLPPMNAMQILLINIIMDGPPAQSLGVEPVDRSTLLCPPRPKSAPILAPSLLIRTALSSLHITIGTMVILFWERTTFPNDTTRTFTVFVLFSMVNALTCRSTTRSILSLGPFTNRPLSFTIAASFILLLAILYISRLASIFQTSPLSISHWGILIMVAGSLFVTDEFIKSIVRRRLRRNGKYSSC